LQFVNKIGYEITPKVALRCTFVFIQQNKTERRIILLVKTIGLLDAGLSYHYHTMT